MLAHSIPPVLPRASAGPASRTDHISNATKSFGPVSSCDVTDHGGGFFPTRKTHPVAPSATTRHGAECDGPWPPSRSPRKTARTLPELLAWAETIEGVTHVITYEVIDRFPYHLNTRDWTRNALGTWVDAKAARHA